MTIRRVLYEPTQFKNDHIIRWSQIIFRIREFSIKYI